MCPSADEDLFSSVSYDDVTRSLEDGGGSSPCIAFYKGGLMSSCGLQPADDDFYLCAASELHIQSPSNN